MAIFDPEWCSSLDLRRFGCKWVRNAHDRQKYHLELPQMKGLGAVWAGPAGGRLWSGTDGRDANNLATAKANVESEVRFALQSELERLNGALVRGQKQPVVISGLAVKTLEYGLESAVFKAVISVANACNDCEMLSAGQHIPETAMIAVSVGADILAFARPRLPDDLCHRLGLNLPERQRNSESVITPLGSAVSVTSLQDLAKQCEQSVYEAFRQITESFEPCCRGREHEPTFD